MTENSENTQKKTLSIVDDDKNTKLHYSAANGKEDLIEVIQNEPKVDPENYLGWTPLMMACRNGHLNAVQILLNYRADATKKNKYNMSVFMISVAGGSLEIVLLILQHLLSGGVSRRSMQEWCSPLSIAILFSHEDILTYLVEQNFNLNAATPITGITPLMIASAMDHSEAYKLLISKGADTTKKNCTGLTAQGITDFRCKKIELKPKEANTSKTPHIIVGDSNTFPSQPVIPHPFIIISPQPTYFQMPNNQFPPLHIRKSSNTVSPSPNFYFTTPNVTPITPINFMSPHQVFFPPDFTSNDFYNNNLPSYYNNSNDFLNIKANPNDVYMSPIPPNMNFATGC